MHQRDVATAAASLQERSHRVDVDVLGEDEKG